MPERYILPEFSKSAITGYRVKTNPWLLFYRFLNGESKERGERLDFFRNKADLSSLGACIAREKAARQSWKNRYGAKTVFEMTLSLVDRMSVGMGIESDFENGLLLHWIHGFPYVNGEAVKGAARAWAMESGAQEEDPDLFRRIFGSLEKQETDHDALNRGEVIFFDAIPESEKNLFDVDIITPHYADYYTPTPERPTAPGGWEQPNPVAFLAVSADVRFLFSLAAYDPELVHVAGGWLKAALVKRGLGAKKRAGYGHFSEPATVLEVSQLVRFINKIESMDRSKLPGQAAELVATIISLPEEDQKNAARELVGRIPKKTLKKKAGKQWVITLKGLIN